MTVVLLVTIGALGALAYAYVGYPALIHVWAAIKPRPVRTQAMTPSVTLITCAYNEARHIGEKIQNALAIRYPRNKLQILVVDDGSDDGTADIARQYTGAGIEVLADGRRRGKIAQMNRAARHASGEILVFSDANVMVAPDALSHVVSNFADHNVGAVVTRKRVTGTGSGLSHSDGLYWRYEDWIQRSESRIHSTVAASGHMQAIRREIMPVIPEGVLVMDDLYMALSVLDRGYRNIFEPAAVVYEGTSAAMAGEVTRRKRITAARFYTIGMLGRHFQHLSPLMMFQFLSHKVLRLLMPFLMIVAFAGNALLVLDPSWAGGTSGTLWMLAVLAFAGQSAVYAAALAGGILDRAGWKAPKVIAVPYFLVSTNMAGLGGFMWFMRNGGGMAWQRVQRE